MIAYYAYRCVAADCMHEAFTYAYPEELRIAFWCPSCADYTLHARQRAL